MPAKTEIDINVKVESRQAKSAMDSLTKDFKEIGVEAKNLDTNLDKAAAGLNKIESEAKQTGAALDRMGKEAAQAGQQMAGAKGIGAVGGQFAAMQTGAKGLASTISGLTGPFLAVGAATAGVTAGLRAVIGAAMESEKVMAQLKVAVENTGVAYASVEDEIGNTLSLLQSATGFDDEAMATALSSMTTQTGNFALSLKELPIVVDVAAAKQIDLASASKLVGEAMMGNIDKLGRQLPEFRALSESMGENATQADKAAAAMELLSGKYGGFAASTSSAAKELEKFGGAWGNLMESAGNLVLPSLTPHISDWAVLLTAINDAVAAEMTYNENAPGGQAGEKKSFWDKGFKGKAMTIAPYIFNPLGTAGNAVIGRGAEQVRENQAVEQYNDLMAKRNAIVNENAGSVDKMSEAEQRLYKEYEMRLMIVDALDEKQKEFGKQEYRDLRQRALASSQLSDELMVKLGLEEKLTAIRKEQDADRRAEGKKADTGGIVSEAKTQVAEARRKGELLKGTEQETAQAVVQIWQSAFENIFALTHGEDSPDMQNVLTQLTAAKAAVEDLGGASEGATGKAKETADALLKAAEAASQLAAAKNKAEGGSAKEAAAEAVRIWEQAWTKIGSKDIDSKAGKEILKNLLAAREAAEALGVEGTKAMDGMVAASKTLTAEQQQRIAGLQNELAILQQMVASMIQLAMASQNAGKGVWSMMSGFASTAMQVGTLVQSINGINQQINAIAGGAVVPPMGAGMAGAPVAAAPRGPQISAVEVHGPPEKLESMEGYNEITMRQQELDRRERALETKEKAGATQEERIAGIKEEYDARVSLMELDAPTGQGPGTAAFEEMKLRALRATIQSLKEEGVTRSNMVDLLLEEKRLLEEINKLKDDGVQAVIDQMNETQKSMMLEAQFAAMRGEQYDGLTTKISATEAAVKGLKQGTKEYNQQMVELQKLYNMQAAKKAVDEMEKASKEMADTMHGMLKNAVRTGMDEGARAGVQSLLDAIKNKAMDQLTDQIATAIMGGMNFAMGNGGIGGPTSIGDDMASIGLQTLSAVYGGTSASGMAAAGGGGPLVNPQMSAAISGIGAGASVFGAAKPSGLQTNPMGWMAGLFGGSGGDAKSASKDNAAGLGIEFAKDPMKLMMNSPMLILAGVSILSSLFGKKPGVQMAATESINGGINTLGGNFDVLRGSEEFSRASFSARNATGSRALDFMNARFGGGEQAVKVEIELKGDAGEFIEAKSVKQANTSIFRGSPNRTGSTTG